MASRYCGGTFHPPTQHGTNIVEVMTQSLINNCHRYKQQEQLIFSEVTRLDAQYILGGISRSHSPGFTSLSGRDTIPLLASASVSRSVLYNSFQRSSRSADGQETIYFMRLHALLHLFAAELSTWILHIIHDCHYLM